MASRICRRSALRVDQGGVEVLYVLDPGPDGSMGDVSWLIEAKQSGTLAGPHLPGRAGDGALARWRTSCCPARPGWRRTRTYTNDEGHRAGRIEGPQPARRSGRRLADPHERCRGARSAVRVRELAGGARRHGDGHGRHGRATRTSAANLQSAAAAAALAAGEQSRWNAGSGT